MTSKEIRKTFLDFFASKGHTIVPSAPMVVKNDPTLMFTNAGMNQFKDWFLGNSAPKYKRVTDSQKCLRVSGKHNDLEEVGHDSYHHTMFEMLGNWSFGDYFKSEAIDWAWELLTEVYRIDKDRLYVTVFKGDAADGTDMDTEARDRWKLHVPEDRILLGDKHDNFWEMGDTGPCGPCSEIHIDLRSDEERAAIPGRELVNTGNPLVIEIWNLVFMQFNRKASGELEPLPNRNVDTGMGFERLCMVLQGKTSNYDTDVFTGMIHRIEELSGHRYGESGRTDVAMRVIADHIRAISFSIADGQLPSNVKAGYVIRRILRRAVRYGYTFLGFSEPFLCRLVGQLVDDMGEFYSEIARQQELVEKVIREEELAFLRTLDRGIRLMDNIMEKSKADKVIKGEDAFVLYDTFGFPVDLSELIASENGYTIDIEGFERELQKQKERARNATAIESGDWAEFHHCENVEFVGYDTTSLEGATLTRHRTVKAKNRTMYQLVFDRTPFYAEMGGEVGDTGYIVAGDGEKISIVNTIKENNLTIHIAERIPADCTGPFTLVVDAARRRMISSNHTATHLLHKALREILGTHVEQKGSFVTDSYFRFDFSHFEKLSDEQIDLVENRVNELIRENSPLEENRAATMEQAQAMGAMALFGEKYGDRVRIVKFGDSVELCGGCHAAATGQIGFFKIVAESAIAAGVRRIEAVTGPYAEKVVDAMEHSFRAAKALFNNAPDLAGAIGKLIEENEHFKKEVEAIAKEKSAAFKKAILEMSRPVNGINVVCIDPDKAVQINPDIVKRACQMLQKEAENLVVAVACESDGKPQLMLLYSEDLVKKGHNAGKDVKEAAKLILGGGGGQPGFATAGGKNSAGLADALERMVELATR